MSFESKALRAVAATYILTLGQTWQRIAGGRMKMFDPGTTEWVRASELQRDAYRFIALSRNLDAVLAWDNDHPLLALAGSMLCADLSEVERRVLAHQGLKNAALARLYGGVYDRTLDYTRGALSGARTGRFRG